MGWAPVKRGSDYLLLGLLGIALLLLARLVLPLFLPVLLGTFLVVLLLPMHDLLIRWLPRHARLAAAFSTIAVFALFLVPLALAGYALAHEGLALVRDAQTRWSGDGIARLLAMLPSAVQRFLPTGSSSDARGMLAAALPQTSALLPHAMSAGAELVLDLFILTATTYYFFLDGRRIFHQVVQLVPLDTRYADQFAREFRDAAHALVYGNALTGLLQGAVGWIGLLGAGVPRPHVWALGIVFASFIPLGGTALLWGPLGVVLILTGKVPAGVFLLSWGALVVSTVDNLARPFFCSARLAVHPLLVSLSIFGGLAVFGVSGLLAGPLVAALAMTLVRIYRRDFLHLPATEPIGHSSDETRPTPRLGGVSLDAGTPPK